MADINWSELTATDLKHIAMVEEAAEELKRELRCLTSKDVVERIRQKHPDADLARAQRIATRYCMQLRYEFLLENEGLDAARAYLYEEKGVADYASEIGEQAGESFVCLPFSVGTDGNIRPWLEFARLELPGYKDITAAIQKYGAATWNVRLWNNGRVEEGRRRDGVSNELMQKAIRYGEKVWDDFYPDAADWFKGISRHFLRLIEEGEKLLPKMGEMKLSPTSIARQGVEVDETGLADEILAARAEDLMSSESSAIVSFVPSAAGRVLAPVIHFDMPHEKYRMMRAIAHVARKVNAQFVILIVNAELDGTEPVLMAMIFEPHGTAKAKVIPIKNGRLVIGQEKWGPTEANLCVQWREPAAA